MFSLVTARALIEVGGTDLVRDPGWHPGVVAVANLPSRISWTEGPPFGGGQWTFQYQGGTAALQAAVDAVANIQPKPGVIALHSGVQGNQLGISRRGRAGTTGLNWSFEAWVPESFERLLGTGAHPFMSDHPQFGQPCPPPRLDVWLTVGGPDWSTIRVPTNVTVLDHRASSRGYSGSHVTVQVRIQAVDGTPLPGARAVVETNGPGNSSRGVFQQAIADKAGIALLSNVPPGFYRISATATDRVARLIAQSSWQANAYAEFTAQLAPASLVRGIVTDVNDAPLSGATVAIRSAVSTNGQGYPLVAPLESTTNPGGQFELKGAPEGAVQLRVSMPGHLYRGPGALLPVPCPTNVVLQVEPTGTLEVTVVDRSGQPVAPGSRTKTSASENVFVQEANRTGVGSWGGSSRIDSNGLVRFAHMPGGNYRISTQSLNTDGPSTAVRLPGSRTKEEIVTVVAGTTNQVRLIQR